MSELPEEIIFDILSHLDGYDRKQASLIASTWRAAFLRKRNLEDVILLIDPEHLCNRFSSSLCDHVQNLRFVSRPSFSDPSVLRTEKQVMEMLCQTLSLCNRVTSIDLASCRITNRIPLFEHENDGELKCTIDPCRKVLARVRTLRLRYCFGWLLAACVNLRCLVLEDRTDLDCSLSDVAQLLRNLTLSLHLPETVIVDLDLQTLGALSEVGVQLRELELATQITFLNVPFCERYQRADRLVADLHQLAARHPGLKLKFAMFIDSSAQLQSTANQVLHQVVIDRSLCSLTLSIRCETDEEIRLVDFDSIPFSSLLGLSVTMHSSESSQCSLFRTVFRSLLPRPEAPVCRIATQPLPLTHLELSLPAGLCPEWRTLVACLTQLRVLKLSGHFDSDRKRPTTDFCLSAVAQHCHLLERLSLNNVDYSALKYQDNDSLITFLRLRTLVLKAAFSVDSFCLVAPSLRTLVLRLQLGDSRKSQRSYLHFWHLIVARSVHLTHIDVDTQLEPESFANWWQLLSGLHCLHSVVLHDPQIVHILCSEWPQLKNAVIACRSLRWLLTDYQSGFSNITRDVPDLRIASPHTYPAYS